MLTTLYVVNALVFAFLTRTFFASHARLDQFVCGFTFVMFVANVCACVA